MCPGRGKRGLRCVKEEEQTVEQKTILLRSIPTHLRQTEELCIVLAASLAVTPFWQESEQLSKRC